MHKIISVNGVSITINKKDILNNINLENAKVIDARIKNQIILND